MGQCPGREKEGRPREVREETEKGKERLMDEGAGQRKGKERIMKEVRGPGLPLQASPSGKGGDLARVQLSSRIWGERPRDLLERAGWAVTIGPPSAPPSLPPCLSSGTQARSAGAFSVCLQAPVGSGLRKS